MKKYLFALVFAVSGGFAQTNQKTDKIIKKDYDILEVNVTKISDNEVEFTFPNETLKNNLSLSKVAKIIFKNGRIQEFKLNDKVTSEVASKEESSKPEVQKPQAETKEKIAIKQNTIAVLPIPFVNSETLSTSSEMAKLAQNDVYNKLIERSKNIFPLTVQDLRTTNSLLKKAGIDYANIDEILIEDLQDILGVDHIVAAKVSYIMTVNQTNETFGNTTINKKNANKTNIDDFSVSTSTEEKEFEFQVYFDIYKNLNKIYTQTRQPFLRDKTAWMDSMQYLLKRCPIYTK